jgi:hypothetical protein
MKLNIFTLKIETDRPATHANAAQLRGFFATKFNDYQPLHQHNADKFVYEYPKIQYKIIDGEPIVIGIEEGVEVLKEIYNQFDALQLGEEKYDVVGLEFGVTREEFGISEEYYTYEFKMPWVALNSRNYTRFFACKDEPERQELLSRTLIGNMISMSKSFKYNVDKTIKAVVEVAPPEKVQRKGVNKIGFNGRFSTNFLIPDLFGIGGWVSVGFGTVEKVTSTRTRI